MTPHRIQRKRTKGWKMPANTVYVGRPSKWGNCFVVGQNYKIGMINTTMNGVVLEQFGRGGLKMADYTSTPTAMTAPWDGLMSPTLAMWKLDTNGVFATKYGTNAGGRAVNTGTTSDTIAANIASTYESANSVTITLTFAAPSGDGERRRVCLKNAATVTWAVTSPATAVAGLPTTFIAGQCVEAVYNSASGTPTNAPATTWVVY